MKPRSLNRHRALGSISLLVLAISSRLRADEPAPPQSPTPNQAMAALAKEVLLKSIKPEYEKRENWGHQKEIAAGYQWVRHGRRWELEKQTKRVNDGLWRMYRVGLVNPRKNLQLRFTKPHAAANGGTAFQALLSARLWVDARQEQWRWGVKGLNFHVEGEATVEARLDIVVAISPVADAGFGAIEVQPRVTAVKLRLVDFTLKRLDFIHGDLARELGNAFEDILAGELRKREAEVTKKINTEIAKQRDKLKFSPREIAEIGWEKIQSLLGTPEELESEEAPQKR